MKMRCAKLTAAITVTPKPNPSRLIAVRQPSHCREVGMEQGILRPIQSWNTGPPSVFQYLSCMRASFSDSSVYSWVISGLATIGSERKMMSRLHPGRPPGSGNTKAISTRLQLSRIFQLKRGWWISQNQTTKLFDSFIELIHAQRIVSCANKY